MATDVAISPKRADEPARYRGRYAQRQFSTGNQGLFKYHLFGVQTDVITSLSVLSYVVNVLIDNSASAERVNPKRDGSRKTPPRMESLSTQADKQKRHHSGI